MSKLQLLDMEPSELEALVESMGQPSYRARQIRQALLKGQEVGDMTVLPKGFRIELTRAADSGLCRIHSKKLSKDGKTVKYLFLLSDENIIEGVLMHYNHGRTLCVSSQVGCDMGCRFCASTKGGKVRDLTGGEMLSQVIMASGEFEKLKDKQRTIDNVVVMGSGEPLDNFKNLMWFLTALSAEDGLSVSLRKVSVSTCGLPDRMRELADSGLSPTMSVSLHAPNAETRCMIMPVAQVFGYDEVLSAAKYYVRQTGRRVIFEYALISGINDDVRDARELASRLRDLQCHVNLIPLNKTEGCAFEPTLLGQRERFMETLQGLHISCTLRRTLGDDIGGACGQLRNSVLEEESSVRFNGKNT